MLQRAGNARVPTTQTEAFPAPAKGWVQSGNIVLAGRDQAEVLDNFIPTAQGARLRGGMTEYADLGTSVVQLFSYASGAVTDLFASSASKVWDADRVAGGGSNAFGDIEGLASGDWSTTQISTSGGQFLVAVNGTDYGMYWDGTDWNPITTVAINNVPFDAETGVFTVGSTVTGGTSGASATILSIIKTSATAGTLRVGTITSGPFQDNEALTDAGTGVATANGASSSGSAVTLTNVATTALSQVWLFKERLFFVEKDTTSAWYLPVESIGGAATEIDLGSVFQKGGNLLFGATWSLDSGSGLDDVCLFFSDRGEIAVYEGTDPASASTWSLVGVYEVGKPLDKHGYFKAGGDLAVMTEDGIIPVSEALRKDRAALQAVAMTYPIEDAWKDAISNRTSSNPITVALWQEQTLLLVGTPSTTDGGLNISFAANSRTGAWGRVTGWDVRCQDVADDQLYFGTSGGKVMKADNGGTDDGAQYTGIYVPKFSTANEMRSAVAVSLTYRANAELDFDMDAHAEYQVDAITAPAPISVASGDTWGSGVWGTFVWGSDSNKNSYTTWQYAGANGYALAPSVAVTSNQASKPVMELLAARLRLEVGYAL